MKEGPIPVLMWVTVKPEFKDECVVVTASKIRDEWIYSLNILTWIDGWGNDGMPGRYLGWCEPDGEEYGALEDMSAQYYLVLPKIEIK